jgi:hypothetical protein
MRPVLTIVWRLQRQSEANSTGNFRKLGFEHESCETEWTWTHTSAIGKWASVSAIFALRSAAPEWSPDAFVWPMAAALLCAPVVFLWYLLWLLPFLRSASTMPIIVWTARLRRITRQAALKCQANQSE